MRCGKARDWLSLALDGQLPPDRTISLEEHLEHCSACRGYRGDLEQGRRLLRATEPQLPAGFEWRLQLKLNQILQEAAQEAVLPWHESPWRRGRWLAVASGSTAVGLAAVLAFALLLPSAASRNITGSPHLTTDGEAAVPVAEHGVNPATWLPLMDNRTSGFSSLPVDTRDQRPGVQRARDPFANFWSGRSMQDLKTIGELRQRYQQLWMTYELTRRELQTLKASLDSTAQVPQHVEGMENH
jgi:anti-sigma factor RsiW